MRLGPVMMVALAACAGDTAAPPGDPPGSPFDRVLAIELEIDPSDWTALRAETRSWAEIYGSCLSGPFSSPFNTYEARVTIDGEPFGRIGLRKRGFLGSLSSEKPSLKLSLDRYLGSQDLEGTTELLLNNAVQDPSYVRQCLTYRLFAAADVPAPRCGFASVRVNGDDLGLYVNVEKVDFGFVTRHFARAEGALYEGTFSDFRDGWMKTFERESGLAVDGEIDAVARALARPDAEVLAAVETLVDVDEFLTFWAAEVMVGHRDGYTGNANNFHVYRDPSDGRFRFIPWGTDGTFRSGPDPLGTGATSLTARAFLPWRLYGLAAIRDRYAARLRELFDSVWHEEALVAELDRMETLIAPVAGEPAALASNLDQVRAFVRGRRAAVLAELDEGPPWTAPPLEAPCFDVVGEVSADLTTRWGTLDGDALAEGDATVAVVIDGVALEVADAGAVAGVDPADPSRAQLRVVATLADGTAVMLVLQTELASLRPGAAVELDGIGATGYAYRYVPGAGLTSIGQFPLGRLEVLEGSPVGGAAVRARFEGPLVRLPD